MSPKYQITEDIVRSLIKDLNIISGQNLSLAISKFRFCFHLCFSEQRTNKKIFAEVLYR